MNRREAVRRGLGRIRIDDESMMFAGINKGDVALVKLGAKPVEGDLCAAFLPTGDLRIRYFYREVNGRHPTGERCG